MASNSLIENKERQRRVYLRVPVRIKGEILVDGSFYREVNISDISSGGLSFFVGTQEAVPEYFQINFSLPGGQFEIKTKVAVRNRTDVYGGMRIGCCFNEISDEDRELIAAYVSKCTDFSSAVLVLSLASFFCLLDSLWRLPGWAFYYEGLKYGGARFNFLFSNSYLAALVLYFISASTGFFFTGRLTEKNGKTNFSIVFACLACVFFYSAVRSVFYLRGFFLEIDPAVRIFSAAYLALAVYTGFAFFTAVTRSKKIYNALDILEEHRRHLRVKESP